MDLYRNRGVARAWMLLAALVLAGCRPEAEVAGGPVDAGAGTGAVEPAAQPAESGPVVLEDVLESDPRYLIGISYPPGMDRHPGLAAELARYADNARDELMAALEGATGAEATLPYDLALSFHALMDTPEMVAVQAEGTLYTGGAHALPLVARFVWLPRSEELLKAESLFADERGWGEVSAYVRESLHTALSQRLDADGMEPGDRARLLASAGRMIDAGTEPVPANFSQFEPVPGAGGRLRALRFVFPPYQVGPYSDGVQTAEVPSAVLLPHLAPEYRGLFLPG